MTAYYYNEIDPYAAQWLRAYGNAINAVQAQIFIEAALSCTP